MEAEMADRDVCAAANRLNEVLCITGAVAFFSTALMSFSHCLFVYVMGEKTRNAIKCDKVRWKSDRKSNVPR